MSETIYTIGHSTHSMQRFIDLLKQQSIAVLCDVRSKPYSRINPQFNRESLKVSLAQASIKYVFLGQQLGARTDDRRCYCNGKVQYDLLAQTEPFKTGIDRLINGAQQYRIALMCAEKEPLDCHRTILVSRVLSDRGMHVLHILGDGRTEEHSNALKRLIRMLRISSSDMFRSEEMVIEDAYSRQGQQIAYQLESIDGVPLAGQEQHDVSGEF